jgi:hypothetical protein
MTDVTAQDITALRAWPKMLALAFVGNRITFQEFCVAQDAFEAVLQRITSANSDYRPR